MDLINVWWHILGWWLYMEKNSKLREVMRIVAKMKVKENNLFVKEGVLLVVASNDATLSRLRSTKIYINN